VNDLGWFNVSVYENPVETDVNVMARIPSVLVNI
jgi:hypothetical protein